MSEAFNDTWWPLCMAVAWVRTRDEQITEQCQKDNSFFLQQTYAVSETKPAPILFFEEPRDALRAPCQAIENGRIEVIGQFFRREGSIAGPGSIETNEPPTRINNIEFIDLRLDDDEDGDPWLIPTDWRVAQGSDTRNLRGYRNPKVSRDDVLSCFAANGNLIEANSSSQTAVERVPQTQHASKRRAKREAASEAIEALYPNGIPKPSDLSNVMLCNKVGGWLKESQKEVGNISDDTILRAAGRRK